MPSKYLRALLIAFALVVTTGPVLSTPQSTDEKATVSAAATAKFTAIPNAPECFTVSVERGDPTKGPSVILAKFAPGCVAPFHWHSPSETVMIVSGSLQTQMHGEAAFIAHHGDFVFMPPRHVHRATCLGAAPCLVFLSSDAAFDIHWVDADGKEISLDAALKSAKSSKAAVSGKR